MSRSKKGSKGPGYDYWGRRPLSGDCGHGPEVKKLTHRIERREVPAIITDEIKQSQQEPMFICSKCGEACAESERDGTKDECKLCDDLSLWEAASDQDLIKFENNIDS